MRAGRSLAGCVAVLLGGCAAAGAGTQPPAATAGTEREYVAYVVSESADEVARLRFGPRGLQIERERQVGMRPADVEGPHGIAVAPAGDYYYLTLGHGTPFGTLLKLSTRSDEVVGHVTLGLFPATVDLTPDGEHAFVANFNLHGDHVPSSVSKVHLPTMQEVARTETCVMPHGSRVNAQGTHHYSACMMDDLVVEIDVRTGAVARRFSVAPGREGAARSGASTHHAGGAVCSPTWAQPGADGDFLYVTCNRRGEVLEIDVRSWTLARRFPTGEEPYNLDVTPDGRLLLATLKNRTAPAVEVIELASGSTVARIATTGVLPHGLAVTADSRYAFVSVEGVGSEPGRVEVIDLRTRTRVAGVEVGPQAAGIAILR